jgi:hypothetical protein
VKRGYCLITSKVPASVELNKINIYLKEASTQGFMCKSFEEYISKLLFQVPMPSSITKLNLFLP